MSSPPLRRLVIIGNGMAGGRLVEDLVARGAPQRFRITVFGDEPHATYNRILLSGVLAGSHRADDIVMQSRAWYARQGVDLRAGVRVEAIDRDRRQIVTAAGDVEPYDVLVLATGSRAFVPRIEGLRSRDGPAFA
jgi:nitrite reductase (NADH) large subunit